MNRLAYFAPLKSPEHLVPSGDRELAASIRAATAMNSLNLEVDLASELRCYDGKGDTSIQQQIRQRADAEVARLVDTGGRRNWQAWITYHNYYKAPDLIGPTVSARLNIPYILIEASIAKSQLTGPWAEFARLADEATSHADIIFYLTERDRVALEQHRPQRQKIVHLPPFLNQAELPATKQTQHPEKRLLAVGMLRPGDKFSSYQIIAAMLPHLKTQGWQLSIVGDGPARNEIEALFAPFGDKVSFLGQLDRQAISAAYEQASVFVWPGVNEAFGMVYLEAQAAGLPVVAQDRPGVREVLGSKHSLVPDGHPQTMASVIDTVLTSRVLRAAMVKEGRDFVRSGHLLADAANTLSTHLAQVIMR